MKPEVLVAGLIVMAIFTALAAREGRPTRAILALIAPMGAASVGVFLVSGLPPQLALLAVVGVVVVAFLASMVRGYLRAGREVAGPGRQ